jgi:hypothetical protein
MISINNKFNKTKYHRSINKNKKAFQGQILKIKKIIIKLHKI